MTEKCIQLGKADAPTVIACRDARAEVLRLCGLPTARAKGEGIPARARGPALINADGRRYEADDLVLEGVEETEQALRCRIRVGDGPLRLTIEWRGCPETGIVRRSDTVENTGNTPVILSRCLARVAFPPGRYACYAQSSRWGRENQGNWQDLRAGLVLDHAPGRTTQGHTPYLVLRPENCEYGVACHVLPCGNWTIRVRPVAEGGETPCAVVELGLADQNLHYALEPEAALDLQDVLFQPVPDGQPRRAAPGLHRYLLAQTFAEAKPEAPVVYNTWFDQFDVLNTSRLRGQLAAAKEVGCEAFVVDAGWYGPGGTRWSGCVGDWREKEERAFCGRMREFADEVREAGLDFGLWMEPERFGPEAPIRAEHPEWFVEVGEMARLDLTRASAYDWLRGEIERLIETYGPGWMKLDFNFSLDADASGGELHEYYAAWYRMLEEIRSAHPGTFFEGCSSGAMRGDLAMLSRVDGHFLSDSVNPVDMLRISQGAWLRLPPGRLTRWAVVRSAGRVAPRYGCSVAESPPVVLTPGGAVWEDAGIVDLRFALLTAMPGMFGLSGDLASLSAEDRRIVRAAVEFYRKWRPFITGAEAHLLTPPASIERREGWVGVELRRPGEDIGLVFIYRLGTPGAPPRMPLSGPDPDTRYVVGHGFEEETLWDSLTGRDLLRDGLPLRSDALRRHGADVYIVRPDEKCE